TGRGPGAGAGPRGAVGKHERRLEGGGAAARDRPARDQHVGQHLVRADVPQHDNVGPRRRTLARARAAFVPPFRSPTRSVHDVGVASVPVLRSFHWTVMLPPDCTGPGASATSVGT